MPTATINHDTLSRLAEAGAVRAAHAVGQTGGWALSVQYGMAERFLAAQRSGKLRLFRKCGTGRGASGNCVPAPSVETMAEVL